MTKSSSYQCATLLTSLTESRFLMPRSNLVDFNPVSRADSTKWTLRLVPDSLRELRQWSCTAFWVMATIEMVIIWVNKRHSSEADRTMIELLHCFSGHN